MEAVNSVILIFSVSMGYLACVHDLKIEQHVHMGKEGQHH